MREVQADDPPLGEVVVGEAAPEALPAKRREQVPAAEVEAMRPGGVARRVAQFAYVCLLHWLSGLELPLHTEDAIDGRVPEHGLGERLAGERGHHAGEGKLQFEESLRMRAHTATYSRRDERVQCSILLA